MKQCWKSEKMEETFDMIHAMLYGINKCRHTVLVGTCHIVTLTSYFAYLCLEIKCMKTKTRPEFEQ